MDYSQSFFRKYFRSGMLLLLVFFVVNALLFGGVLLVTANSTENTDISIAAIAACLSTDEQGNITAAAQTDALLTEQKAWAMVLDDSGSVIWESQLPSELPRCYTSSDIAQFSRWYLQDYPVLLQVLDNGLLVVGYPRNSLSKLYFITNYNFSLVLVWGTIFAVCINILLVFLLLRRNNRQMEKAVVPVLQGIESLARGEKTELPAKGELAAINISLNQAGRHIAQKDQARSQWITGISHDVRTPLAVMLGYAGELEDDPVLPQPAREQAAVIRRQGEKLRRLIADLNLTSKLEYAMQPLQLGPVYPLETARQVICEVLNNGLDEKYTLELNAAPTAESLVIQGDAALLERLLDNLIQNSISHNPQGCRITVTVQQANDAVLFAVEDNGAGISPEQLQQFNRGVFPEHAQPTGLETAHGIGLRLVWQIAQAHGGQLEFTSGIKSGLNPDLNSGFNSDLNADMNSGLYVSLSLPLQQKA